MLDQAKSSARSRGLLAPSPQPPETDPRPLPEALSRSTETEAPLYSIRVAENSGCLCVACSKQETGAGPVGYIDDDPVCDLCLLEGNHELGMVLAVISVVRAYASVKGSPEEWQSALEELGAFARVYDRFAAKSGPARLIRIIPDFGRSNDTTH